VLNAFYGAFSPTCFALLGLWMVVIQLRLGDWRDAERKRRSYGIALHFALPGMMSVFALIDAQNPAFWRVSFAVIALGGAAVLAAIRGFPVQRSADGSVQRSPGGANLRGLPAQDQLALAAYVTAIVLYTVIGVLAVLGGLNALRAEAVLLTIVVFLGFNVAFLLLFDDRNPSTAGTSQKTAV
jgi:hypothetical protein